MYMEAGPEIEARHHNIVQTSNSFASKPSQELSSRHQNLVAKNRQMQGSYQDQVLQQQRKEHSQPPKRAAPLNQENALPFINKYSPTTKNPNLT